LRLHGTLWRLRCCGGCGEVDDVRTAFDPFPPVCACGALQRPAVVWFGEALPAAALAQAEAAARAAAVVVVAGTSSLVYPAAALPRVAHAAGAFVVEVNPEPTPLSDEVDLYLGATAGTALPAIAAAAGAGVEA
jgi:NAD-dependent deacetylase